jgi:hypothetical protein
MIIAKPVGSSEQVNEPYNVMNDEYVEPISEPADETENLTKTFSDFVNAMVDALPESEENTEKKNFFRRFCDYIKSEKFDATLEEKAEKYKVPKKQIAKNFFLKVLGIIGDALGIVIDTVCNIASTLLALIAKLLNSAICVVNKAMNGLASLITLNQTVRA